MNRCRILQRLFGVCVRGRSAWRCRFNKTPQILLASRWSFHGDSYYMACYSTPAHGNLPSQSTDICCAVLLCCWHQVTFPLELDVYDFCTPELQKQLAPARTALKDYQDKLAFVSAATSRCLSTHCELYYLELGQRLHA
eukprot:GHUV01020238.1.p1 GENE.GHUV01020238.1~~GHUV01020238.1.p1  ORF type:complete len:139 (-),score=21.02 GHUV01020238.1:363-779(-)